MSNNSLKKGMLQILLANILNMIFSIGTNFLLPKFLSIDSYSQIKTYQLYVTYVAILHLGYNDGMYLKFGGKNINEISNNELEKNLSTLKIFQFIMMIFSILISIFTKDIALLMASIVVLPQNMIAYFKNFYQAIGEFKKYSRIMNITTSATFIINIFLIFIIQTDNYVIYLLGYIILSIVLWFMLEKSLSEYKHLNKFKFQFSWKELKDNISSGILLLLGNFSSQLLSSMDRWFIKILFDNIVFAQYSFAVSMENFLNVAVTPISVTMYNYFCNHDEDKDILKIRDLIIIFASIIIAFAFPVKFILELFLQKYLNSTAVIFILFSAQMFYIIIKSVYVNLYKSRKMQKKYSFKLVIILIIAFICNIIGYLIYNIKESFAIGTLLSAIIWFFISQLDFKSLKYSVKHYIYIFTAMFMFLLCGYLFNSIIGLLIYMITIIIMMFICMSSTLNNIINIAKGYLNKFKKRGNI